MRYKPQYSPLKSPLTDRTEQDRVEVAYRETLETMDLSDVLPRESEDPMMDSREWDLEYKGRGRRLMRVYYAADGVTVTGKYPVRIEQDEREGADEQENNL